MRLRSVSVVGAILAGWFLFRFTEDVAYFLALGQDGLLYSGMPWYRLLHPLWWLDWNVRIHRESIRIFSLIISVLINTMLVYWFGSLIQRLGRIDVSKPRKVSRLGLLLVGFFLVSISNLMSKKNHPRFERKSQKVRRAIRDNPTSFSGFAAETGVVFLDKLYVRFHRR